MDHTLTLSLKAGSESLRGGHLFIQGVLASCIRAVSAAYCRSMAESEKPSESLARRVLTRLLGYQMMRVETGRTPTPDYRILEPPISIEVKELTSEDHRSVRGATRTTSFSQSPLLSGLWTYLVLTPSVSEALAGVDFTDRPRGRKLESQMIKQLEILEQHNIDDYRNLPSNASSPEAYRACLHIGWLLRGGECSRMSSIPEGLGAGVIPIGIGLGHVRNGDPNTIVALVRLWLEMKSGNMRTSLGGERGERHGVLVADANRWRGAHSLRAGYRLPTHRTT